MTKPRPGGRAAEALRNNERILAAAREVLAEEGYDAPMAAIARRAGVGVGTLYSRYPSKERLVQQMSIAGMEDIGREALAAAEGEGAPWERFEGFMSRCVAAGAGELMQLAGQFPPTAGQQEASERLHAALELLLEPMRRTGLLGSGITPADIYLLLAHLRVKPVADPGRNAELRQRYLALVVRGLRADPGRELPGPPPTWEELARRWDLPVAGD